MIEKQTQLYYKALLAKDNQYEGVFYVGVKTTGVFCRPTCPARKPKIENCEFFKSAQAALLASYRPCKRCKPLSHPNEVSDLVRFLVDAVEREPTKRWKTVDFKNLSIDESTARRQFKKRFGMTFVAYARARRMGEAMKEIRGGSSVIEVQLQTGYESGSGFRDAFSKILGDVPARVDQHLQVLKATWTDTILGPMVAMADDNALYLLEFVTRRGLEREVERLRRRGFAIIPGENSILSSITRELKAYFEGTLFEFKTPYRVFGSPFQQQVWDALCKIPYGETRSYKEQAISLGKPSSFRAVANANGMNQLALIIPCHRVIASDGTLGGYGGGIAVKQWLLEHEKQCCKHGSVE
ncbi:bifunctional transcriptional activator/DNA repair enzyme AdaA [Legionella waltersii]|uniref:methylated-DNA--[protein]-cysteine S-methyltransferase n=1 Tax=Legionella waltersii TaxID=66969 RepID=A0A0W1A0S3_9GAMM|nr:trifunctional transcriptional activator/DNA repair protein Ada/methylated-DNA--[protein]-cysteine S-methyltransferase [Legionella waltersii]KTD74981.1 transcription regulator protein [Legionella waltersii]SNV08330.1 transcription regulator protein [Legionella waltersii]